MGQGIATMSQDFEDDMPSWQVPVDPIAMARRDLKKALPKRFYAEVSTQRVEGGYELRLDGRPVRTPAKALLVVPTLALAEVVATEWRGQIDVIDPFLMPMTRLVNSAIDGVAHQLEATIAEVAKFAETDLVCYRAGDPAPLVAAQSQAWDPILAIAQERFGARFICSQGIVYVEQPETSRAAVLLAVRDVAAGRDGPLRLAALSVMTSLTGSVLIALAVVHGVLGVEQAWRAAHVDEDYQIGQWGADADAAARRDIRWRDMDAAASLYALSFEA